ncbi:MAG: repressor LexA [Deltaproteobacteria bacterium]|nr:repressor LexA [Deltaproteobacteria bacterium]
MAASLTNRQQKVLSYIQFVISKTGSPPTHREIASHLGVTVRSAYQHVVALERKEILKRAAGHRGIELLPSYMLPRGLPILGRIAAGIPILAEENVEGRLALEDILNGHEGNLFLLRVSGDSMIERGVNPGDLVLIRQQPAVENGEVAAVLIGEEATLKIFRIKGSKNYLESANKKYKPLYFDRSKDIRILGKALMALRSLEKRRAL